MESAQTPPRHCSIGRNIGRSIGRSIGNNLIGLVLGVLLGACTPAKAPTPTALRIGVQPNEKTADLESFRKDLSSRVGMPVEMVISPDYADLVSRFKEGRLDFAFFSPLNFVQAERDAGAKVLLKKVYGSSEFYWSTIVTRPNTGLKTLADLKGRKFAFVDPKSASGYLYPLQMLKAEGVEEKDLQASFVGTHDAALLALWKGEVDAAAVWGDGPDLGSGAWTPLIKSWASDEAQEGASAPLPPQVLAWSDPIPNDAFAVRADFYQKQPMVSFKVMEALIGMGDEEKNILKQVFDTDRMATATSRHYDAVRKLEQGLVP